ncbi:MAG: hypothetical protein KDB01_01425 [Planctomycetaceae bacterium]|nr:hypothetical protein [Planctomycetaceae bacterium]
MSDSDMTDSQSPPSELQANIPPAMSAETMWLLFNLLRYSCALLCVVAGIAGLGALRRNPEAALQLLALAVGSAVLLRGSIPLQKALLRDALSAMPSRKLGWIKVLLGLSIAGLFLVGVQVGESEILPLSYLWFGVLNAAPWGITLTSINSVFVSVGFLIVISGTLAQFGTRPSSLVLTIAGVISAPAIALSVSASSVIHLASTTAMDSAVDYAEYDSVGRIFAMASKHQPMFGAGIHVCNQETGQAELTVKKLTTFGRRRADTWDLSRVSPR